MTMTFDEAKELLSNCRRSELRDHAFGDREIFFTDASGNTVAEGYSGSSGTSVYVNGTEFEGKEGEHLATLGHLGDIERNDSTGPEEYREGECMSGLTHDGVLDELTR